MQNQGIRLTAAFLILILLGGFAVFNMSRGQKQQKPSTVTTKQEDVRQTEEAAGTEDTAGTQEVKKTTTEETKKQQTDDSELRDLDGNVIEDGNVPQEGVQ